MFLRRQWQIHNSARSILWEVGDLLRASLAVTVAHVLRSLGAHCRCFFSYVYPKPRRVCQRLLCRVKSCTREARRGLYNGCCTVCAPVIEHKVEEAAYIPRRQALPPWATALWQQAPTCTSDGCTEPGTMMGTDGIYCHTCFFREVGLADAKRSDKRCRVKLCGRFARHRPDTGCCTVCDPVCTGSMPVRDYIPPISASTLEQTCEVCSTKMLPNAQTCHRCSAKCFGCGKFRLHKDNYCFVCWQTRQANHDTAANLGISDLDQPHVSLPQPFPDLILPQDTLLLATNTAEFRAPGRCKLCGWQPDAPSANFLWNNPHAPDDLLVAHVAAIHNDLFVQATYGERDFWPHMPQICHCQQHRKSCARGFLLHAMPPRT